MKLKGQRQSTNIEYADPAKSKQLDPNPYLPGRTRMPYDPMLPPKTTHHTNKSAFARGGFVNDFVRGFNRISDSGKSKEDKKSDEELFPAAPDSGDSGDSGGGLYAGGGAVQPKAR